MYCMFSFWYNIPISISKYTMKWGYLLIGHESYENFFFLCMIINSIQLLIFQFWSNVDILIFGITTLKVSLHLQCNKMLLTHQRSTKNVNNFLYYILFLLPNSSSLSFNSMMTKWSKFWTLKVFQTVPHWLYQTKNLIKVTPRSEWSK